MNRPPQKTVSTFLIASIMLAIGGGAGWWAAVKFQPPTAAIEEEDEHDADTGHGSDVVEISESTLANMDLEIGKFELADYFEKIRIPAEIVELLPACLLYTSPSPRDLSTSRMPSSA